MGGMGCEEIGARRGVQEANRLYERGKFAESAARYEESLKVAPHLDTAHFNAGLAYRKMFRPGVQTPENLEVAERATYHMAKYIEMKPEAEDVDRVIALMTRVWNESGNYKAALGYWGGELEKDPKNTEIMGIMAGINRQAGDWEQAIEWHLKQVEVEEGAKAKANAYKAIGTLLVSRLRGRNHEIIWHERLQTADSAIAALQKANELVSDDADIETSLGFLYGQRALAQLPSWAQVVEIATARHHYKRWVELNKKAQAAAAAEAAKAEADSAENKENSEE